VIGSAPLKIGYGVPFEVTLSIRTELMLPAMRAAIVNPGFGGCPARALLVLNWDVSGLVIAKNGGKRSVEELPICRKWRGARKM
jgi:hypothetical protein